MRLEQHALTSSENPIRKEEGETKGRGRKGGGEESVSDLWESSNKGVLEFYNSKEEKRKGTKIVLRKSASE